MKRQKKFIGPFILGLCLITTTACAYTSSVNAQENSMLSSIKEKSCLNSIVFHKEAYWDRQRMLDIKGNHLNNNGQLTPSSNVLEVSTKPGDDIQVLLIRDRDQHRYQVKCNSHGIAKFDFRKGELKENEGYGLYVSRGYEMAALVASFKVSDRINHRPPTLIASNKTVIKDDPVFNIMDGVSAHDDEGNDITQKIIHTGNVDIHKVGDYNITYSVTDSNGLSNSKSVQISVKDNASSLTKPVLDEVTDSDTTITGKGTPNTDIYVILGTSFDTYREKVKTDGTFIIPLEHPYPAGTSIQAYSQDVQGNKSENYYGVIQTGNITIGVNQILSADTFVSGYTSPGAKVEVAVNNTREHLFTGTADGSGKYNIGMHGLSYPAGTSVRVTASLNNHSSSKTVIVYPKRVSIDTAKSGDSIILGEADPNATVHLYVHGKNYQFKVDAAGNFRGNIDLPLVNGDRITAYQVSNDIESEPVTVYVASK